MQQHTDYYEEWIQSIRGKDLVKFMSLISTISDNELNAFYENKTPLMIACDVGFTDGVKQLLDLPKGRINFTMENINDYTAFALAVYGDHNTIVDYMFDKLPLQEKDVQIALFHYSGLNDLKRVKICIEQPGVDVNFLVLGCTALTQATFFNAVDVVKYLLSQKTIDTTISDNYTNSPMVIAMSEGHNELVQLLLPTCNISQLCYCYGTTIPAAILFGFETIAEEMIDQCSKEDLKNHPVILQCAILKNSTKLVAKLIAMGIDVNELNYENFEDPGEFFWRGYQCITAPFSQMGSPTETVFELPLVLSVREGNAEITRMLMDAGADPYKKGLIGCAYNIAETEEIQEIVGRTNTVLFIK